MTETIFLLVAFSSFLFKDDHFVAFEVLNNFCCYSSSTDSRGANIYLPVVVNQKNFIKGHFRTFFVFQSVNENLLVFLNFILMPCYFYNCIHVPEYYIWSLKKGCKNRHINNTSQSSLRIFLLSPNLKNT